MESPRQVAGVILAAGKGTRMKSDLPKGLHPILGVPMLELIGRAMKGAGVARPIVVIGHGGEAVQQALGTGYEYVWQREQLGTGHAASMAAGILDGFDGEVLVVPGDAPLIESETLQALLQHHRREAAACTMAIAELTDPTGYGRIIRNSAGVACRVVEEKDADPDQKRIREVCTSFYCFDADAFLGALPKLKNTNAQGEYYLTDVPEILTETGKKVETWTVRDDSLLMGVNDRYQLAEAGRILQTRIVRRHALNGVSFTGVNAVTIGPDVTIGVDTIIGPGTVLLGSTAIGARCRIGPNAQIEDSHIGDGVVVLMSLVTEAEIGNEVRCGPFANLRPKSRIGAGSKIGNFVEVKNSTLAPLVSASHLSYIGDASVGSHTNVGAGTITCNYDGFSKNRTEIGENVFVGSNSTLVAPLTIGDGALIAAGSVITQSVPADAGAFGRARQETKEQWAAQWRRIKRSGDR